MVALSGCNSESHLVIASDDVAESDDLVASSRWTLNGVEVFEEWDHQPKPPFDVQSVGAIEGDVEEFVTTFHLKNETGLPREVVSVRQGCGCTDVEFQEGVVPPGGELKLTIRLTTSALTSLEGKLISFKPVFSDGRALSFVQQVFYFPRLLASNGTDYTTARMLSPETVDKNEPISFERSFLYLSAGPPIQDAASALRVKILPDTMDVSIESVGEPYKYSDRSGVPVTASPFRVRIGGPSTSRDVSYSVLVSSTRDDDIQVSCFGKLVIQEAFFVRPRYLLLRGTTPGEIEVRRNDGSEFAVDSVSTNENLVQVSILTSGFRKRHVMQISLLQQSVVDSITKETIEIKTTEGETVSCKVVSVRTQSKGT